jgi:hypothetical protein
MRLGILVNTDRHLNEVIGISEAAVSKGHEVIIFNTDEGTKLLNIPEFQKLCTSPVCSISFCDHSARHVRVVTEGLPEEIVCGSQYHLAIMLHDADKVIVL